MIMNKPGYLVVLFLLVLLMIAADIAAAQQTYPAAGSLESAGEGLWNYYRGKTKATVRKNAPMFERLNNSNSYLLDYTSIKGVDLYLSADFQGNKLVLLQILTPFPEFKSCNKDAKDTSRSFAEVGAALMGVQFDSKKQCTTLKENGGTVVCTGEDFACVYRLCPDENWAYACSVLTN